MRRGKKKRDYTNLKPIGIKTVDEAFKVAVPVLKDGTDLREAVHSALASFRENCGAAAFSNIKQCIRVLASRIQTSCEGVQLCLLMKDEVRSAYILLEQKVCFI